MGRMAIVTACDLEIGDFEGFLFLHANTPLGQFEYLWFAELDAQAMVEQFAFGARFVLAALRQVIGAAAKQKRRAERGAG